MITLQIPPKEIRQKYWDTLTTALENGIATLAQNLPAAKPQAIKVEALNPKLLRIVNISPPEFEILVSWEDNDNLVKTVIPLHKSKQVRSEITLYFFTPAGFESAGIAYLPEQIASKVISGIEQFSN